MNLEEKQKFLISFAFIITVFGIIFLSLKFMTAYLLPFVIGVIIAYIVQKPAAALASKIKLKKEICAAILSVFIYAALLIIVCLAAWFLFSRVDSFLKYLGEISDIFVSLSKMINQFTARFTNAFDGSIQSTSEKLISDTISGFGAKITAFISNTVTGLVGGIPTFLVSAVVTVVATCYISKDYDRLKNFLKGIISKKTYQNAVIIKNIFTESVLKFLSGYLLLTGITFTVLLIGFFILRINHFFITALLIAVIDLLPVLGTGTVLLPWSVILFLQGDYKLGIGIIVLYLVVSVVRNFAEPKVIGKQMGINPLFTLISMFLGLKLAGVAGMIIFPISLIVIFTFYRKQITEEL